MRLLPFSHPLSHTIAGVLGYFFMLLISIAPTALATDVAEKKPLVITTVKPLALIAAQALGNRVRVEWLYAPQQSPHHQPLRPSMLRSMESADLIVWVGPILEGPLASYLEAQPQQRVVTFAELVQLEELVNTKPVVGNAHVHGHDHDQHDVSVDPHLWLQPAYAEQLAAELQSRMGFSPQSLLSRDELGDWYRRLGRLQNRAWLMPHRSLDYFSDFFMLNRASALATADGVEGGLRHQLTLLEQNNYRCIMVEQSEPDKRMVSFAQRLARPVFQIDTLGASQPLTHRPYSDFLAGLVETTARCLSAP